MLILYFSDTGNSKYIATQFALKMGADRYSIEEEIDFNMLLDATETVAVCYPIYGSCVPCIMRDFVARHSAALKEKTLIIFCTQMMFSGDGARAFSRLLPGRTTNARKSSAPPCMGRSFWRVGKPLSQVA